MLAASRSQAVTPAAGAPRLLGRATGTAVDSDLPRGMDYAVLDLGPEVLVARYVGSDEALSGGLGRAGVAPLRLLCLN